MRKLLVSAALILSSAIAAAPAAAQYYPNDNRYGYDRRGGQHIERQLYQLRQRVERAEDRDRLSPRERNQLLRQIYGIDRLYDRYRRNGLTRWEMQDIQNRVQHLRQRFRWERQDDRWDDRRDRWDDRRDRRDDDRWDDDGDDDDDRWDDDDDD